MTAQPVAAGLGSTVAQTQGQNGATPVTANADVASFHSSWADQSGETRVVQGHTTTLTVRFRNTGTAAWVLGAPGRQANLAIVGDGAAFASSWLASDRVAAQSEAVVAPGEIGTFTFAVRAPDKTGTYRLSLRPVIDGTTWMEDQGVYVDLTSTDVASELSTFAATLFVGGANEVLVYGAYALCALLVLFLLARLLSRARRAHFAHT